MRDLDMGSHNLTAYRRWVRYMILEETENSEFIN